MKTNPGYFTVQISRATQTTPGLQEQRPAVNCIVDNWNYTDNQKENEMTQTVHLTSSAQLYENEYGDLAIRFENNEVFEGVGTHSDKSFAAEALEFLKNGARPAQWQEMPYRKLQHDSHGWRLVSSIGFLDGDEMKPAVGLDIKPEELGARARRYLQPDMPQILT